MVLQGGLRGEGRIGWGRAVGRASDETGIVGDLKVVCGFDFCERGEGGFEAR